MLPRRLHSSWLAARLSPAIDDENESVLLEGRSGNENG